MDEVTADELDKEQLTQLHNATLKVSDTCFELKKLCATVLVPTATLLSVFTNKRLDASVFVAALLVITAFWLADSTGYYYQRKLRNQMAAIWKRRAGRCPETYEWTPSAKTVNALQAAVNWSMAYYLMLVGLILIGLVLYLTGAIGTTTASGQS